MPRHSTEQDEAARAASEQFGAEQDRIEERTSNEEQESTQESIIAGAADGIAAAVADLWLENAAGIQELFDEEMKARVSVAIAIGHNDTGKIEATVKLAYGRRIASDRKVQLEEACQLKLQFGAGTPFKSRAGNETVEPEADR